jgi:putative oxidoreductase
MNKLDPILVRWSPRILSITRIMTGFLFMPHGAQKLFGWLSAEGASTASLLSLRGVAGVLEFFGGFLILVGLYTRSVAFLLSGMMAVAYFMAHAPRGFWPIQNRGELAALYCFVFLYLFVAGGGAWSLDELLRKRRQR